MRVVADLERLQTIRLEVGSGPDLTNLPSRDGSIFGHQPDAPMRCLTGYTTGRQREDFVDFLRAELARLTTARQVVQSLKTGLQIAFAPFEYHRCGDQEPLTDLFGHPPQPVAAEYGHAALGSVPASSSVTSLAGWHDQTALKQNRRRAWPCGLSISGVGVRPVYRHAFK